MISVNEIVWYHYENKSILEYSEISMIRDNKFFIFCILYLEYTEMWITRYNSKRYIILMFYVENLHWCAKSIIFCLVFDIKIYQRLIEDISKDDINQYINNCLQFMDK